MVSCSDKGRITFALLLLWLGLHLFWQKVKLKKITQSQKKELLERETVTAIVAYKTFRLFGGRKAYNVPPCFFSHIDLVHTVKQNLGFVVHTI